VAHPDEVGLTNLGPVPDGMTFLEATLAMRDRRKYQINPQHQSRRLTLCETAREIWRRADAAGDEVVKELAAAVFDYGKRMNARMVELRDR
jgi:hypothetical protein